MPHSKCVWGLRPNPGDEWPRHATHKEKEGGDPPASLERKIQVHRGPKTQFKRLPILWHTHLTINHRSEEIPEERTSYLLESFQNTFQVFISPEEIRKGPFHRVKVSQGLLLLHGQLLEAFLRGHTCPLLIFCESQSKAKAHSINKQLAAALLS